MPLPDGTIVAILADDLAGGEDIYLRFMRVGDTWMQIESLPHDAPGSVGYLVAYAYRGRGRLTSTHRCYLDNGRTESRLCITTEERGTTWVVEVRDATP